MSTRRRRSVSKKKSSTLKQIKRTVKRAAVHSDKILKRTAAHSDRILKRAATQGDKILKKLSQ